MKKRGVLLGIGFMFVLIVGYVGIRQILPRLEARFYPPPTGVIALISDRTGNADIYLLDVVTGDLTNITNTPEWNESDPAWSPDGSQLLFTVRNKLHIPGQEVNVMNADGTGRRQLTLGVTPAWSPDGKRIFVSGYYIEVMGHKKPPTYSQGWIGTVDTTGENYQAVTQQQMNLVEVGDADSNPAIAPDGRMILYEHFNTLNATHVFRANADGSNAVQLDSDLVDNYLGSTKDPAWSPDGMQIALSAASNIYSPQAWPNPNGLYVGDRDGNNWRMVVSGFCGNPTWSPDGAYIAYDATYFMQNGNWAVMLVTADGNRSWHMTPSDGYNYYAPAWRPHQE